MFRLPAAGEILHAVHLPSSMPPHFAEPLASGSSGPRH